MRLSQMQAISSLETCKALILGDRRADDGRSHHFLNLPSCPLQSVTVLANQYNAPSLSTTRSTVKIRIIVEMVHLMTENYIWQTFQEVKDSLMAWAKIMLVSMLYCEPRTKKGRGILTQNNKLRPWKGKWIQIIGPNIKIIEHGM